MKTLENRVAVITGAGGGVGRCLATQLAASGCHLALVDINAEALQGTEAAVKAAARQVKVTQHCVDITDKEQMSALAAEVERQHGGVNILINNAGITIQKSFSTHSISDWERMININIWGVLYGCHYFLDGLRRADEAHIVNMSSMSAFMGLPNQSSYCATKSAVQGLSESLWAELADEGVGVTSVHPGAIKTDMIKATLAESDNLAAAKQNYEFAQRTGVTPEHAAERIIDAIRHKRLRIRVGKDSVMVDLLKRLLPKAIHKPMLKVNRDQKAITE